MKPKSKLGTTCSMTMARHSRIAYTVRLLLLLVLLALPAVVQAQFNYTTNNGTITITGYTGPGGAVTIPSTINGLPVTRIGDYAFWGSTSLTSVTIPNSVTSIEIAAFSSCTSLTSVTIPNSVTSIESLCFDLGCIGAFSGCTSLTNVTIGNSVTNIGEAAFYGCTSLTAITVDALNSAYSSVDGVLFNKSQTTLVQYPWGKAGSYTIPNSVADIGAGSFSQRYSLTSVTIPNSVTSIGGGAFSGCTSLTSITIPNSVTNIGGGAFHQCTSLTSVTIGNSVTTIGYAAFYGCTSLASATIGNSVTNIGPYAFAYCTSLTRVTIPNSVTSIGYDAFDGCTSLTNVTIGNSVTNIEWGAFYSCTNLTGVYFQGNAPSVLNVFEGANQATIYYLPGTTGWGATFAGRPTALWVLPYPLILNNGSSFGVQTNGFGFIISWATHISVVVEASPNLSNPVWTPVSTNTLTGGSSYFSDPQWTNHPARFYRLRSP